MNLFLAINVFANNNDFNMWLTNFKVRAINSGISNSVVDEIMSNAKFLPKVIQYDRFQPEFYEDTFTYIKKRSSKNKIKQGIKLYKKEKKVIEKILYGSWAGAFGNFQFMPRTIKNYAIDYNKNKTIELKKTQDSFASAANYLKTIGWKKNKPCYFRINLKKNIPKKYLNSSARNIKNKRKVLFFKKYIVNFESLDIKENLTAAIIIPDKDIIPGAETLSPAYIIFENYEKILNWNRSLRFALAVCTLKNSFKNEI